MEIKADRVNKLVIAHTTGQPLDGRLIGVREVLRSMAELLSELTQAVAKGPALPTPQAQAKGKEV